MVPAAPWTHLHHVAGVLALPAGQGPELLGRGDAPTVAREARSEDVGDEHELVVLADPGNPARRAVRPLGRPAPARGGRRTPRAGRAGPCGTQRSGVGARGGSRPSPGAPVPAPRTDPRPKLTADEGSDPAPDPSDAARGRTRCRVQGTCAGRPPPTVHRHLPRPRETGRRDRPGALSPLRIPRPARSRWPRSRLRPSSRSMSSSTARTSPTSRRCASSVRWRPSACWCSGAAAVTPLWPWPRMAPTSSSSRLPSTAWRRRGPWPTPPK